MRVLKHLKKDKLSMLCLIFLIIVLLCGIFAPFIATHTAEQLNVKVKFASSSLEYPFGTDHLGRCIFSRILYGIRNTVFLAVLAMIITMLIGTVLGVIAGFFRGWVDEVIMRICDIMLSFPSEVMVLAIVGVLGAGMSNVILANIIAKWAWYTRMIRTIVIQYMDKNYIRFAKVAGCRPSYIILKHLLPNTVGEIIVLATLDTGAVILNISALSFLGLGAQAPMAEWGRMLNEAKSVLTTHPVQMLAPGLAIMLVVAAFNFLGDGLQDAFNPKHVQGGID